MSGPTQSCSCSTSITGHASLPAFLLTTSALRANCGVILFTTGMLFAQPVTAGRLIACAPCLLTWMQFVWITSAGSRPRGMFRQAHQRLSLDNGYRGRARSFLKRFGTNWVVSHSSSKIWVSLLRTYRHCATSFNCQEREFCNLPLTVILGTPTF